MRSAILLPAALLLAAGVAWSQGGAGGRGESAVQIAAPVVALPQAEPLTLRGPVLRESREATGATSANVAAEDTTCLDPFEEVVDPPPDPVETGVSTLVVTLRDDQGATPASIDLELWRLGAPANEHWLEGDQLQVKADVEDGRVEWTGLPEGTYRLFTGDARVGAEDPPAFHVGGALTVIEATLALPRRVRVLVQVLDEHGQVLREGRLCTLGCSSHGSEAEPAWRQERRLRRGMLARSVLGCCGCGIGGDKTRPAEAGDEGFDVGSCPETRRARSSSWTTELSLDGRSSVTAFVDSDDVRYPEPTRYVAVSVPLHSISDHVWTPDGRLATEAGARFTTRCRAVRLLRDGAPPDPRTLPIEVQVCLAGCEPLTFETHPGQRPVARTLVRAVAAPESAR